MLPRRTLVLIRRNGGLVKSCRVISSVCKNSPHKICKGTDCAKASNFQFTQAESLSSINENVARENIDTSVSDDGQILTVKLSRTLDMRFHSVWLRHNCHCENCRASSGQRSLSILDFPKAATIARSSVSDGQVELLWTEDPNHVSEFPLDFLKNNCYNNEVLETKYAEARPVTYKEEGLPTISYNDIQRSRKGMWKWLSYLSDYGMSLVKDIPTKDGMVAQVAENIAPVQVTSYGRTFQVVNEPDPINIAYSMSGLNLHMDLLNYESPPGLQFLHCLSFDECVEGGDSRLLDVFHVAEQFRISNPEDFQNLARIPASFQRIHFQRDRPVFMTFQRPHILLNHRDEISSVFWTQQNEGALCANEEDVEPYYEAYRNFAAAIRDSDMIKSTKLTPGDAIVFNNRRVLHGRDKFTLNGGRRHFEGCYVNIDEFKSRFRCLSRDLGRNQTPKRVGNQCWF